MNNISIDLWSAIQEYNKASNTQSQNFVEYGQKCQNEKMKNLSETLFPNLLGLINEDDLVTSQLQNKPINNDDQYHQLNNLKESSVSDTQSLSFISDIQKQFNIQEIPYWFKDLNQYGEIFQYYSSQRNFVKINTFENLLINNFSIIINQGYDTKLFSGFNKIKMGLVILKEQIVADNQLMIAAQQFIIQDQIYQLYPNQFLELLKPVYINQLDESNKFQFISQLEYGEINLYDYSQQNQMKDLEFQLIFQQIYLQIKLLHNHNIAHRDIKPQNIVYVENKGWLLCDFGDSMKYENVNGIYDIKGTKAFLQAYLQILSHSQGISIQQNLFVNDIYALAITLIIIKYQIKHQDEIQHYINQPGDLIIESLIKNPDNIQSLLVETEQSFIKIQIKKYYYDISLKDISIYDIWSFTQTLQNIDVQPEHKDEIQQKLLSLIDQKLAQNDKYFLLINIICFLEIPEQVKYLKNSQKQQLFRQSNYWKKIFNSHLTRNFIIVQIIFMDKIGLSDWVLYYARVFLSNDYNFMVHLIIIKNLILLKQWEQAKQEYNLLTKYREFREMNSIEIKIFNILSVQIVNWNQFNYENTTFMRKFLKVEQITASSFLEHYNQDLQLLANNIMQFIQKVADKQLFIFQILDLIMEFSNYLEIKQFLEFLNIMKQKIKYFCPTYLWQQILSIQAILIESLKSQYNPKTFSKEMNYVMLYNCESVQQYKCLKFFKLLTLLHQNMRNPFKEQKMLNQIYQILIQLNLITIKLYKDDILSKVISKLCAYMHHYHRFIVYQCFRILIYFLKRPNYKVELDSVVRNVFIIITQECFRQSQNFKRYCQFIQNGESRIVIKNFIIKTSEKNKLKIQLQLTPKSDNFTKEFLYNQYCYKI